MDWLHQRIERVIATLLQVDASPARIDHEDARASQIRSYLPNRGDRKGKPRQSHERHPERWAWLGDILASLVAESSSKEKP